MKVYDFKVLLEPDEEDGGYVVSCPALAGCYSQGDTVDEALENIKEAIILCLDESDPDHLPLTVPDHKTLKPGLLRKLLRDADLTVGEFVDLLE